MRPRIEPNGQHERTKSRTVPLPTVAGYENALRAYFASYRSNLTTFFSINAGTIHAFEVGTEAHPAVFNLSDALAVFDTFFRKNGDVNAKSYRQFLNTTGIDDGNRYAQHATSARLRDDVLELALAVTRPKGRAIVLPEFSYILEALRKRMRMLAKTPTVKPMRFLPAFHDDIELFVRKGMTQAEIAAQISKHTANSVTQVDISRFLTRVQTTQNRFEQRRFRAAVTLDMVERYSQARLPTV